LATSARDRGVALQAWLYHLLGGEASGLETPESWRAGKSSKRLLSRVKVSVAAAAKECAQTAAQLRKLRSPGAEPRARAPQLGWRMVQEAAVTELTLLGAGWFALPYDKRVSAPVAAPASVSPEGRVWQLTEELRAERAHSDEMRIELETPQRELKRALRREECGAAAVVAEGAWAELQIKMMAQEHEVRHPPKRESRAPSSPLLTPPSHPSHAGRDARASHRERLQGARDDETAQGGLDRVAAQGQPREERGRVQAARAGTQEPRGAAAGCGVAARRRGGRGHDGHARARSRVNPVSVQAQAILEAFSA